MSRINTGGVIKGGLVAGLIINISQTILNVPVLGPMMQAELAARNLPEVTGAAIGIFVVMCFVLGLLLVWLYAAVGLAWARAHEQPSVSDWSCGR